MPVIKIEVEALNLTALNEAEIAERRGQKGQGTSETKDCIFLILLLLMLMLMLRPMLPQVARVSLDIRNVEEGVASNEGALYTNRAPAKRE